MHTRKDEMSNWESKYENRTANASDVFIWSFSEEIFLGINLPVTGKEVKITHNIEIEYVLLVSLYMALDISQLDNS